MKPKILVDIDNVNSNEVTRQDNENKRQVNEISRQNAESARVSEFEQIKSDAEDATNSANTAATNANNATSSANEAASSATSAASAANTAANSVNTAINNAESATDSANTAATNANDAASSANTAINAINDLNTSVTNAETARQGNETTRQNNETVRTGNETQRVNRYNDFMEFYTLYAPDSSFNMTTEVDGNGRIVKKKFSDINTILREQIERSNFNANNNPQTLVKKTYDQYAKGTDMKTHNLTYDANGKVLSDTVSQQAYEKSVLTDVRNAVTINPLNSFNYTGGTTNANIFTTDGQTGTSQLVNDISALEVHGSDIYTTYTDGQVNNVVNNGSIYVGGDTADLEYDFSYKVANSVAECPMKLYKGEISDIANLPSPTVNYTNAVSNSDFSNGTTGWLTQNSTQSVAGGINTVLANATGGRILTEAVPTWLANNKYYIKANFKADSTSVGVMRSGGILNGALAHDGSGNYITRSYIFTMGASDQSASFGFIDMRTSGWTNFYAKSLMLINLTALFGSGKEPDLIWCDTYLPFVATTGTTMNLWKEITSQTVLDRLKSQNELLVSSIASDRSTVTWNSKTLSKITTLKVIDDFVGKVSNSTVENPNKAKYQRLQTTLQSPTTGTFEGEVTYSDIATLNDSKIYFATSSVTGQQPQILLSWDIISIIERRFGAIPKETLSEKIEWAKTNISNVIGNFYIYGSNPTGNKAYYTVWKPTTSDWQSPSLTNTSSSPTKSTFTVGSAYMDRIDANGFIHFNVYTDSSNGTIPSTIYLDYASCEITLKAPENMVNADVSADIVTDFQNKISGSVVENANKMYSLFSTDETHLHTPNESGWVENSQSRYDNVKTLNGVVDFISSSVIGSTSQRLFSFSIISAVEKQLGMSIPSSDKVQWCKDNLSNMDCYWTGYGSCPTGNKAYLNIWRVDLNNWHTSIANNTSSSPTELRYYASSVIANAIDSNGMVHFMSYTDASNGTISSTIYTDYIRLVIKLKYIPSYDFYTDTVSQRRDAGLTDIVLVKRNPSDMVMDYTGKVSGSVTENPHISKYIGSSSLQIPSAFTAEFDQTRYNSILTLNSTNATVNTTVNGNISQQLFSFNIIAGIEKALGRSLQGVDLAAKIANARDMLNTVTFDWWGFGSSPSGNGCNIRMWNGSSWDFANSHASANINKLTWSASSGTNKIQSDGFIYALADASASDGTTASVISTDYVKLTLTFKSDTTGYEFMNNQSLEISVTTNQKYSSYLIEAQLSKLATDLVSGSYSALKGLIKNTSNISFYAIGTGANGSQIAFGVTSKIWNGSAWTTLGSNTNQAMALTNRTFNNTCLTSDNKIYFLLHSNYKSDTFIGSECVLDYLNIKLQLTRTVDIANAIPMRL